MKILDLGCGDNKYKSDNPKDVIIGIDINPNFKPDKVYDLNKGIPYGENTFDMVYAHHFLEHIKEENKLKILKEIHRVTKKRFGNTVYISRFKN